MISVVPMGLEALHGNKAPGYSRGVPLGRETELQNYLRSYVVSRPHAEREACFATLRT